VSVIGLIEAGRAGGRKAAGLALLLRAGLPVPDGFVVTEPDADPRLIAAHLRRLGDGPVAVRSSGIAEDTAAASFAGQLESVLGVRGIDEVRAAIRRCAASAGTPRARAYHAHMGQAAADVPVIVQALVDADHAGVLFTRDPRTGADRLVINASWGLGESVVAGAVVPDEIIVTPPADTVEVIIGTKQTRVDAGPHGLVHSSVPAPDRARGCVPRDEIARLVDLGRRCEAIFGRPQDVEWAARDGRIWVLQSRPITTLGAAVRPAGPAGSAGSGATLVTGAPGSPGRAQGPARPVRSVDDFSRVRPGDVLVCRTTDPAWTPLFRLAGGVVTEAGGALCHAAIVAREYGIPAVVGARDALARLPDGRPIAVDGTLGIVTALPERHHA
jgi:pyruvate,water dikinase